jgi:hypothetical protein
MFTGKVPLKKRLYNLAVVVSFLIIIQKSLSFHEQEN